MAVGADKTNMNLDKDMSSIMVNKYRLCFFFITAATVFDAKHFITVQTNSRTKKKAYK